MLDQPLATAEFVALDTETNGLGGERCELTEIGAVLVGGGELHEEWASLVVLSGGWTSLGVGVGWLEVEFRVLGVPHRVRGRRLDEMLEAVTALWAGVNVTYQGALSRFVNVTIDP